jgi:hypothetical protein
VTLNVVWPVFAHDRVSFSYPTFGRPSEVLVETLGQETIGIDVNIASGQSAQLINQFGMVLLTNPAQQDLLGWFHDNVDPTGALLASGAFELRTLTNGGNQRSTAGAVQAKCAPNLVRLWQAGGRVLSTFPIFAVKHTAAHV